MAFSTDKVVEDLVESIAKDATAQQRHWLREALLGLVRHAKLEQLVEIRLDVKKSVGSEIIKD